MNIKYLISVLIPKYHIRKVYIPMDYFWNFKIKSTSSWCGLKCEQSNVFYTELLKEHITLLSCDDVIENVTIRICLRILS